MHFSLYVFNTAASQQGKYLRLLRFYAFPIHIKELFFSIYLISRLNREQAIGYIKNFVAATQSEETRIFFG